MKRPVILFYFLLTVTLVSGQNHISTQNDSLRSEYSRGNKDWRLMPQAAFAALKLGNRQLADSIAADFLLNYLPNLRDADILQQDVIALINRFDHSSDNAGFRFYEEQQAQIDRLAGKNGYARAFLDRIIARENVDTFIYQTGRPVTSDPPWQKFYSSIMVKYGREDAERIILNAKIRWYGVRKDSAQLLEATMEKLDKYPVDTAGFGKLALNNVAWNLIFLRVDDKKILSKGLEYMKILLRSDPRDPLYPFFIDTYANLLYKLGDRQEALAWEQKAVVMKPGDDGLLNTYKKMEKNEKTWP